MARQIPGSTLSPHHNPSPQPDVTAINLTRLLGRLENNILSPSADLKALAQSPYHRARVEANINHASMLLLQLEHSTPQIRIQSQKKATQADLVQKRQLIKRLGDSLAAISQEADAGHLVNFEDDTTSGNGGELLAEVDRHSQKPNGTSSGNLTSSSSLDTRSVTTGAAMPQDTSDSKRQSGAQATPRHDPPTTTLRNRRPGEITSQTYAQSTAATTTSSQRFEPEPQDQEAHTEALHAADVDHETLITSTLSLAQALKAKSLQFQTSLSGENAEVLSSALRALDRNQSGMSAAQKKMGLLKQMSEGRGLWGRMMLYAWIAGLWVLLILLVFVAPKLRF